MKYDFHTTKHILNTQKNPDGWFWTKYSAYPYVGCAWGCEYCYWRDEKYNPHKYSDEDKLGEYKDPFSQYIKVKKDAPEIFRKQLAKKPIDLIYLDNYQPVEKTFGYASKFLEACYDLHFPVFINEKSDMLLKDLELLKKVNKRSYVNVGWSIITFEDNKKKLAFEPKSPSIESRFRAMKLLADNGIMTGTIFMPILPFIFDDEDNIKNVIRRTKESGGQYVLDGGLTLWGYVKKHYYKALEKYDKNLIQKYDELFSDDKKFNELYIKVHELVLKYCKEYELESFIPRYVDYFPKELRLNKNIAADLFTQSREIWLAGGNKYREWAYRKAAIAMENLEEDVLDIYKKEGLNGLVKIKNIGDRMSRRVEGLINQYS